MLSSPETLIHPVYHEREFMKKGGLKKWSFYMKTLLSIIITAVLQLPRNQKLISEERHKKGWPQTIEAFFFISGIWKLVEVSVTCKNINSHPSDGLESQYMADSLCSSSLTTYRFSTLSKREVNTIHYQSPPTHKVRGRQQVTMLFFLYFRKK